MRRLLIFVAGSMMLALAGFLSVLLGLGLSSPDRSGDGVLVVAAMGLLLSLAIGYLLLRALPAPSSRHFIPLAAFLAACFLCGLLLDAVPVPYGFKLIAMCGALLLAGLGVARYMARTFRPKGTDQMS